MYNSGLLGIPLCEASFDVGLKLNRMTRGAIPMGKRSDLSVSQRREEPAGKLARRFGISEQTLY